MGEWELDREQRKGSCCYLRKRRWAVAVHFFNARSSFHRRTSCPPGKSTIFTSVHLQVNQLSACENFFSPSEKKIFFLVVNVGFRLFAYWLISRRQNLKFELNLVLICVFSSSFYFTALNLKLQTTQLIYLKLSGNRWCPVLTLKNRNKMGRFYLHQHHQTAGRATWWDRSGSSQQMEVVDPVSKVCIYDRSIIDDFPLTYPKDRR